MFNYVESVLGEDKYKASYADNKSTERNVILWHYFNKLTGRHAIIANGKWTIYIGDKSDRHGKLPFILVQHYRVTNSLYGWGIPKKIESIKPYINNILKVILD